MILTFIALSGEKIRDFENGRLTEKELNHLFISSPRIGLRHIDRVVNVLAADNAFSKYWDLLGSGETLVGGSGKSFIADSAPFEKEIGGRAEIGDPAVYMACEDVKKAAALLNEIDEAALKNALNAKIKKATRWHFLNPNQKALREQADEIHHIFQKELKTLHEFYRKTADNGDGIVLFPVYEEEDYESG